jgi:hypothetical protein
MKKWLLSSLVLLLTGCRPEGAVADAEVQARQTVAREYVQRLIAGDVAGLAAELEPALRKPDAPRVFSEMRALLPAGAPTSVAFVGFAANRQAKELTCSANYQYGYPGNKWFLVVVAWREKAGAPREITGLRVTKLDHSLQETNAFNFAHARPRHYIFLAGLILVPVFILVSLVTCLRMNVLPAKWVWVILIVVGVTKFTLNWTSGALIIMPVAVQIFGVGVIATGEFAPWIVAVSLPLGAMAFWVRRWQVLRAQRRGAGDVGRGV